MNKAHALPFGLLLKKLKAFASMHRMLSLVCIELKKTADFNSATFSTEASLTDEWQRNIVVNIEEKAEKFRECQRWHQTEK